MKRMMLLSCLCAFAVAGCAKDGGDSQKKSDKPAATQAASKAPVEPGSHEDWCEEHAVPESQCTQCDPSLAAAFKATGDWCEEHGVPESQCRKCNPDLKLERPPKEK